MAERWKPVSGYPNYEVSDSGRVKNINTGMMLSLGKDQTGYPRVCLSRNSKQKVHRVHRLVGKEFIGDHSMFDHINRDRTDNRTENIRGCTHASNNANAEIRRDNTTGYKGVSMSHKTKNKYIAYINKNRKRKYLGLFATAKEAAIAYNDMASKLFGEFANLNIITE